MPDLARLHHHKLVLEPAVCPYYCSGCNQLGFGLSYVCKRRDCNFFLHEICGNPKPTIKHPFTANCHLTFREGGSGEDKPCDACGKNIRKFHYRCRCMLKKHNLHPACVTHEKTLPAADGLTMQLEKAATANCLHCRVKYLGSKVRGWAYVSPCDSYCYHLICVRVIINKNWKYGFKNLKSDPFYTIKKRFPDDINDETNQQAVVRRGNRSKARYATAVLGIIFNVVTGNPWGLIGAAQAFFG